MTDQARILVVEDNALNMELFAILLEDAGHLVIMAQSGQHGIDLAISQLPDLIIMDVSLPDMDGLEATRKLKENPVTRLIPVVAVTAHAMKDDEVRVKEMGCSGYITKPIDTRSFAKTVASFLRGFQP